MFPRIENRENNLIMSIINIIDRNNIIATSDQCIEDIYWVLQHRNCLQLIHEREICPDFSPYFEDLDNDYFNAVLIVHGICPDCHNNKKIIPCPNCSKNWYDSINSIINS